MAIIHILSAGAAQSVVEQTATSFTRDTDCEVKAAFGAVGAMKARVIGGEPADVIILTAALIDELVASSHVVAGSRRDLGTVGTGAAVRAGTPVPSVATSAELRSLVLGAGQIVFPDPALATAGKVVMQAFDKLGVSRQVGSRVRHFPNGYAAMAWLAQSGTAGDLGITQTTEILANQGVTYIGPLPAELQMKTVYCAGGAAGARNPDAARQFIARLTAPEARAMLQAAGYEL